jgi:hypothetical protein
LEKLGFPWILSFETRLINGLHGIFGGNIFAPLSPCEDQQAASFSHVKSRIVHERKYKCISAFPQVFVGSHSVAVPEFCFSVMAGLDPAIYENTAVSS